MKLSDPQRDLLCKCNGSLVLLDENEEEIAEFELGWKVATQLWEQEDVSEEDIQTIEELIKDAQGVLVVGEWSYPCGQSILFMDSRGRIFADTGDLISYLGSSGEALKILVKTGGEPGLDAIGIPDSMLNMDAPLSVLNRGYTKVFPTAL